MQVYFCKNCSGLVASSFLYCPYCGKALQNGPCLAEILAVMDRLQTYTDKTRDKKIDELLSMLDTIVADTEVLLNK